MMKFPLTSEQCELLCALESGSTISTLAEVLKRDTSVISRQLQKLAEAAPVLEKHQGRWQLSPLGKEIAQWSRSASASLNRVFSKKSVIRVGTTHEFAARVIGPQIQDFIESIQPGAELVLQTHEAGVEGLLIKGEVDFGFDCGRPNDPSIRFKLVLNEPMTITGSSKLFGKKPPKNLDQLFAFPNLQYLRMSTSKYLKLDSEPPHIAGYFTDLATIREACCSGLGWAILPRYAIEREVNAGALRVLNIHSIAPDRFGIWWPRGMVTTPMIAAAEAWLSKQKL